MTEQHLSPEDFKLPPDEGVIVWVDICGDEGSSPVHTAPHGPDISHCLGRKVLQPMVCMPASSTHNLFIPDWKKNAVEICENQCTQRFYNSAICFKVLSLQTQTGASSVQACLGNCCPAKMLTWIQAVRLQECRCYVGCPTVCYPGPF